MKRTLFTVFALFSIFCTFAQESNIAIKVAIPEDSGIPEEAISSFETRLKNIANSFGILTDDILLSQFVLTAKTDIISQNIVGSAPTVYAVDVNINLYVGDWIQSIQFENTSFRAKGTGQSEAKAYLNALQRVNISAPAVKDFLEKSKKRIIDFYNSQGDAIIKNAYAYAAIHDYGKALYTLFSVPSFCTQTYAKAQEEIVKIYQKSIDYEGLKLLDQATAIWNASQNREGAIAAGALLAQIEPNSSARKGAETLNSEIKNRIGQEWKLELKKYDDKVAIEKQMIDAARQIGVAYGNGQKPSTTNIVK